jgi:ADP-heptose:LPS heptosyltransferase
MNSCLIEHQVDLLSGRRRYWVYRILKKKLFRYYVYPLYDLFLFLLERSSLIAYFDDLLSGKPRASYSRLSLEDDGRLTNDGVTKKPKLVIIRPDHIGDFLYSLPSFLLLKEVFSNTHYISVMVDPCNAQLAKKLAIFDEVIVFPVFNKAAQRCLPSIKEYKSLKESMGPIDCVIDLKPDDGVYYLIDWLAASQTYRICNHFSQIDKTVSTTQTECLLKSDDKNLASWFYSRNLKSSRPHLIFNFVKAVIKDFGHIHENYFDDWAVKAHQLLVDHFPSNEPAKKNVAICLEARDPAKIWEIQQSKILLTKLMQKRIPFHLIGQKKQSYGVSIPDALDHRGSMSLLDVFMQLSQSSVYLGFDSGLAHFCALRGIPTICIYTGITHPSMWRGVSIKDNLVCLTPQEPIEFRLLFRRNPKVKYQKMVDAQQVMQLLDQRLNTDDILQNT